MKYVVCDTGYTARIAENPLKKNFYGEESDKTFIYYTYDELLAIFNGDETQIKEGQGYNSKYEKEKKIYLEEMGNLDDFENQYYEGGICEDEFEELKPFFIHDCIWTKHNKHNGIDEKIGYYVYSGINLKTHIEDLFRIIKLTKICDDYSGIIVFKQTGKNYPEYLKKYDYNCMYGDPVIKFVIDDDNFGIMHIVIDGESG